MGFASPADHRVKLKESQMSDKYLDLARKLKKNMEHESDGTIYQPFRSGRIRHKVNF